MNPLVSVIINCYNSQQYLSEAIESVINQTYNNLEIIIWDNKSSDNTKKIVDNYNDERIKYFISETHTNLSTARHNAILSSAGQWFAFLDSDDVWEKEKLFNHIEIINKNNNIGLSFSQCKIIRGNKVYSVKENIYIDRYLRENKNLFEILLKGNFIFISSVIFKKKLYTKDIYINSFLEYAEDYDLLLNYSKISNYNYVNKKLVYYRIHSNNLSNYLIYKNVDELLIILNSHLPNNKVKKAILYQFSLYFVKYLITLKPRLFFNLIKKNKNPFKIFIGIYYLLINKLIIFFAR